MRRRLLPALLLASVLGAGCNAVESVPGAPPDGARPSLPAPVGQEPERLGTARQAISASEVLTRAQEWVDLEVPYCGGVNGGTDYICGGTCDRPSAPWDDFRTDCSGFVSWCWQIPSDPTTDSYMNDNAGANGWTTIAIDELAPGDAIVCDGHIKLFSQWVSDTEAEIYEEYNCGKVARRAVQSFTRSDNHMFFSGDARTYHPIRRNGIEPLAPVKGTLDAAGVYVKGWALDTKAPGTPISVDVAFDGAPGDGYTVSLVASDPRPDVGDALGVDPNHGFSIFTPLYYCDGAEHAAHAAGHAVDDGAAVALASSPKTFTCPVAITPKGALRRIASPSALDAWSFSRPADQRWMTKEDHATHPERGAWPDAVSLGRTSDGNVWVVDGGVVRHVPTPEALVAWRFDAGSIEDWSSADLAKYERGQALPDAPTLVQEVGDSTVYVLDAELDDPIDASSGASMTGTTTGGANANASAEAGAGCSMADAEGGGGSSAAFGGAIAIGFAAAAARRRRRASRL